MNLSKLSNGPTMKTDFLIDRISWAPSTFGSNINFGGLFLLVKLRELIFIRG